MLSTQMDAKVTQVGVLVQPEMEKGRSPLVSIPPFGQDHCSSDLRLRSKA
jgi:hypothetical protein